MLCVRAANAIPDRNTLMAARMSGIVLRDAHRTSRQQRQQQQQRQPGERRRRRRQQGYLAAALPASTPTPRALVMLRVFCCCARAVQPRLEINLLMTGPAYAKQRVSSWHGAAPTVR